MKNKFAKVVLEQYADKEFDYIVPGGLLGTITRGSRVNIPVGRRRTVGYVVDLMNDSKVKGLREIDGLVDPVPIIGPELLRLIKWASEYYCCSVGSLIKAALPAGVRKRENKEEVVQYIAVGKMPDRMTLEKMQRRSKKQFHIISELIREKEPLRLKEFKKSYNVNSTVISPLVKKGYAVIFDKKEEKKDLFEQGKMIASPGKKIDLTSEQEKAVEEISEAVKSDQFCPYLLFGVTGSGKTEVYLRVLAEVLNKGKTAIILVPEISLTPQTVERFRQRFGNEIAVLHSALTVKARLSEWKRISEGKARIVIGARSSILAPIKDLGLIVVDEEHDKSFKQETNPRYNARDLAVMRAKLSGAVVILGSATPSLESYQNAQNGKYKLIELSKRVDNKKMPRVLVVDMKREMLKKIASPVLSDRLRTDIGKTIDKGHQVILFLNRRGFSSFSVCDECGHVIKCEHCSISLTYHRQGGRLLCHMCGYQKDALERCPSCKAKMRYGGFGTQRVEDMIIRLFPKARVARMDTDATALRGSHQDILGRFKERKIDILVGTQMIAKGLDFPNVTLVGVINADVALNFPDFRSGESTFQLLTQVAGRSGRGDVEGEVVIQSFLPDHYAIDAARQQDYRTFFKKEYEFREQLRYPPVVHFVSITIIGKKESRVMESAMVLEKAIDRRKNSLFSHTPPVPAAIPRARSDFRWQMILKGKSVLKINGVIRDAIANIKVPHGVKFFVDVDPQVLL